MECGVVDEVCEDIEDVLFGEVGCGSGVEVLRGVESSSS